MCNIRCTEFMSIEQAKTVYVKWCVSQKVNLEATTYKASF